MDSEDDNLSRVVLRVESGSPCILRLHESWMYLNDPDGVFRPWASTIVLHKLFTLDIDGVQYESIGDPSERSITMECDSGERIRVIFPLRVVTMKRIGLVRRQNPLQIMTTWNLYWSYK